MIEYFLYIAGLVLAFLLGWSEGYDHARKLGVKSVDLLCAWAFMREAPENREKFRRDLNQFFEDYPKKG